MPAQLQTVSLQQQQHTVDNIMWRYGKLLKHHQMGGVLHSSWVIKGVTLCSCCLGLTFADGSCCCKRIYWVLWEPPHPDVRQEPYEGVESMWQSDRCENEGWLNWKDLVSRTADGICYELRYSFHLGAFLGWEAADYSLEVGSTADPLL